MHGKESGRGAYVVKGGMCGEEGGMYGKEGACMAKEDVHGEGGHAWQRGGACMAGDMATAADGTHPTGMHSCYRCFSVQGVGGGSLYDVTSCLAAWSHVPSRDSLPPLGGGSASGGRSASRGSAFRGGLYPWVCLQGEDGGGQPPPQIRKAGGTHPTGMFFCFARFFPKIT